MSRATGSSPRPDAEATAPIYPAADRPVVYTIGHSTRSIEDFLALLEREHITHLADVRTFPSSRRYPHFNRNALAAALAARGIGYSHHAALGGRRRALPDSVNLGWRNAGFRGYADHMETPEFAGGLERLIALARTERVAVMCAEAVPWQCHRSLLADALIAKGVPVLDIMDAKTEAHRLTSFSVVHDGRVTYPAEDKPPAQVDIFDADD